MASRKQHAAIDLRGAANITVDGDAGTSGQVLTSGGSGAAMTWEDGGSGLVINDSGSGNDHLWSAAKIISNNLATMGLSQLHPVDKFTVAIEWERTLAISSTGWAQGSGSGYWQANQSWGNQAQTSTTGSGSGALFNVGVSNQGVATFTWVSGGGGYAVNDTLTFTDPGNTSQTCEVTVSAVVTPTGISFSGNTGAMSCNINHELDTKYITVTVMDKDNVLEQAGNWMDSNITVIDEDNIKLEYFSADYPSVGEDKFITIIG